MAFKVNPIVLTLLRIGSVPLLNWNTVLCKSQGLFFSISDNVEMGYELAKVEVLGRECSRVIFQGVFIIHKI